MGARYSHASVIPYLINEIFPQKRGRVSDAVDELLRSFGHWPPIVIGEVQS